MRTRSLGQRWTIQPPLLKFVCVTVFWKESIFSREAEWDSICIYRCGSSGTGWYFLELNFENSLFIIIANIIFKGSLSKIVINYLKIWLNISGLLSYIIQILFCYFNGHISNFLPHFKSQCIDGRLYIHVSLWKWNYALSY